MTGPLVPSIEDVFGVTVEQARAQLRAAWLGGYVESDGRIPNLYAMSSRPSAVTYGPRPTRRGRGVRRGRYPSRTT